jgi:hypothetical protein
MKWNGKVKIQPEPPASVSFAPSSAESGGSRELDPGEVSHRLRTGRPSLGSLLTEAGLVTEDAVKTALGEGIRTGERLGEVLVRHGWVTDEAIAELLAKQWQVPFLKTAALSVDPMAMRQIPLPVARELDAVPIGFEADGVVLAIAEPSEEMFRKLGERIRDASYVVIARSALDALLESRLFSANPIDENVVSAEDTAAPSAWPPEEDAVAPDASNTFGTTTVEPTAQPFEPFGLPPAEALADPSDSFGTDRIDPIGGLSSLTGDEAAEETGDETTAEETGDETTAEETGDETTAEETGDESADETELHHDDRFVAPAEAWPSSGDGSPTVDEDAEQVEPVDTGAERGAEPAPVVLPVLESNDIPTGIGTTLAAIEATSTEIAHVREEVLALGRALSHAQEQLAERDAQLSHAQEQLAERDAQLSHAQEQLAERDAQLEAVQAAYDQESETVRRLEEELANQSAAVGAVKEQIAKLTQTVDLIAETGHPETSDTAHADTDTAHPETSDTGDADTFDAGDADGSDTERFDTRTTTGPLWPVVE